MGATQAGEAPHALRLTALVAAARVAAAQGRAELAAAVASALAQAAQAAAGRRVVVQAFRNLAQQGGGAATVLPFTADPLTLDFASLAYPQSSRDAELRLYSSSSVTDLGYVLCTFHQPVYVDRAQPKTDATQSSPRKHTSRRVVDLPDQGLPDDWLDALCASDSGPPQALLALGAGDTLHLRLTPGEPTRWLADRGRVRLVLLKAGTAGRVARRDLGPVAVKGQGGNGQTLVVGLRA